MLGLGNGKGDVMDSSTEVKTAAPTLLQRGDGYYVVPIIFSKVDEGRPGFVKNIAVFKALCDAVASAFGVPGYVEPVLVQGECHNPVPLYGTYEAVIDIIDRRERRASAGLDPQGSGPRLASISGFFSK